MYGVDYSVKNYHNVNNYHISSIGLSELPYDLDVYKRFGYFDCEPFTKGK